MNTRSRERLHELLVLVHRVQRSLRSKEYDITELEPGISQARDHSDRLEKWLDEMAWIADNELVARPYRKADVGG